MARTEAEVQTYTIGEVESLSGPILLTDYDPNWRLLYERESARARGLLGSKVLLLEHVGSTSVVGLPAKPIIDMVMAVSDSAHEAAYCPEMERGGYVLRVREPDWFEHRMFKGPDTKIHLHVFTVGCSEIEQMVLFRDWLRQHAEDREQYAATKRRLAKRKWSFVQDYADAKTGVVREILARARSLTRNARPDPRY